MRGQRLYRGNIKGSGELRIGVDSKFGQFVIFNTAELEKKSGLVYPDENITINYVEVLMAVKNALLNFRNGQVQFENDDGTEVWQLILNPVNKRAKCLFDGLEIQEGDYE